MHIKYIIVILIFVSFYFIYITCNNIPKIRTNNIDDSNNKSDNDIETYSNKRKHVRFCQNIDVREPDNTNYYGSSIDQIDNAEIDKAMADLMNKKVIDIKEPYTDYTHIPVTETDQNKMFDELEAEIKKQYDEIYQKDGYFKSVERPNIPTAIANGNKMNSELNPALNLNAFDLADEDIAAGKTLWEVYDNMTTNNFKQYSNLDLLNEKENPNLYNIGDPNNYGGTKFDTYGL